MYAVIRRPHYARSPFDRAFFRPHASLARDMDLLFDAMLKQVDVSDFSSEQEALQASGPIHPFQVHLSMCHETGVCYDRRQNGSVRILPADEHLLFMFGCKFSDSLLPERKAWQELKQEIESLKKLL